MDKRKLHDLIVSLGSNIHTEGGDTTDARQHLEEARQRLSAYVEDMRASHISTTQAIGINASDFCNQLIHGRTRLDIDTLGITLKEIETRMGRRRTPRHEVAIDIDLLKYDETICHEADWQRDYVKDLLCDILPKEDIHNSNNNTKFKQ